jgi:hypothetical protein
MKKKGTTMGFNKVVLTGLALLAAAGMASAQTARKAKPDTTVMELKKQVEYLSSTVSTLNQKLSATKSQLDQMSSAASQSANVEERVTTVSDRVTGHDERLATAESDIAGLKKLKVSGYLQARYEYLDYRPLNDGATTTSKYGVASTSINGSQGASVFYVRRGRIKFVYTQGPLSQYCIYPDFSKNTVSLKEAWVSLAEPWTGRRFALTMGQMNWPWGIEIERSSSVREVPERSQMANALFPGERDRGVKLTGSPINGLTVDLGVFNGWGINNSTFTWQDPTRQKDFIGRAKYDLGFAAVTASYYDGQSYSPAIVTTTIKQRGSGATRVDYDTTITVAAKYYYKGRISGGLEAYYQFLPFGSTALLAEGLIGKEMGKKVQGGYLMLIQNIGTKLNLALRGDMYNSNKEAVNPDGTWNKYNNTWVITPAINYWWDDAVRLTVAYDFYRTNSDLMIQHSNPLLGYTAKDPRNTNKLTCQAQFKF